MRCEPPINHPQANKSKKIIKFPLIPTKYGINGEMECQQIY